MKHRHNSIVFKGIILLSSVVYVQQASAADNTSLAKAAQNPLATMVTLPLQANYNLDFGANDRTLFNLNVQPVVPIVGEDWNVIIRTIIPVNSVPQGANDSTFGVGDTNLSMFWSPAKAGKVTWGVGPSFGLPTASDPQNLGSEKFSVGPTGIVFYSTGHWTLGGVVSNLWSVGGSDSRADINQLNLQYFVNYNLGEGWAVGTAPNLTANWEADSDNTWTIPWGLQVSKIARIGSQPVNLLLGYYNNSDHPDGAAEAQVRLQLNFLFPTGK